MMTRRHLAMAFALSIVFGVGWVFGKTATTHFPPVFVAMLRFGIAGFTIISVCGWPTVPPRHLLFASACAISIPYSLSYAGLSRLDVSVTVLLIQLEAPILITLSAIWLREFPSRMCAIGVAIAVGGVVFVAGQPSAEANSAGIAIVIASMVVWAIGQIQVRRLGLVDGGIKLLGALSIFAAPQLFVLSLIFEQDHISTIAQAPIVAWLQIGYLGLVMTVLGIGTWYYLVARYPLHLVAPFLLLVPVCSVAGGVVFLSEVLTSSTIFGGVLIMIGVAVATIKLPRWSRKTNAD
ncbi:MAG: EamA family transporter [Roseobacter sp.]